MEILRMTFSAEGSCVAVMCLESWKGQGVAVAHPQDNSGLSVQSESIRCHPRAAALNASHRQGTQCTHCLLFKSHRTRVKRNLVCSFTCHWVVCTCLCSNKGALLCMVGVMDTWETGILFSFFSPKFINCERWQVANANMKFLMLLINGFDYAMELSIPKK